MSIDRFCDVLGLLRKAGDEGRTPRELAELTGITRDTAERWLDALHAEGHVFRASPVPNQRGRPSPRFVWQVTPFGQPDA